jgi:aryl-alcohol dehydrogenase-like predicted oxidoreductase
MEMRRLGRTDLNVSLICLGTMTWGDQNTEAEGHEQMDYALDQGVNFFDTAEMYSVPPKPETQGSTERIIGNWFKARGTRSKVILASKVAGRTDWTWMRDDKSPARLIKAQVDEAVAKSLKRLQTDYIDLYQVHWPERAVSMWGSNPTRWKTAPRYPDETPILETLAALDAHVKAGRIRHIGLSNESPWGTMTWLKESEIHGLARVQSIQNAYSLVNRTFEMGGAEIAEREQVGLLAYSPLAQGYLAGKYRNGALPEGARKTLYNRLQRYESPIALKAIDAYCDLAAAHGITPAQLALAFVNTRSFVTSNIIGASTMAQLKEDIGSVYVTITAELEAEIDKLHSAYMNPAP